MRFLVLFVAVMVSGSAFAAQITLTWQDNSSNETGFRIERADGLNATQGFVEIATVGANVVTYVDTGLPNAASRTYRLRAYNVVGNSAYSNSASTTTPPLPPQVPNAPGTPALEVSGVLTNISTRGVVIVNTEPLIGGFVISGGPAKVLLRGIGPGLAQFNVPTPMADPQLSLFSGQTQIGANDNWSGQPVADAAAAVGAFALATGSKDAASLLTLPAGSYTVHVAGVGGGAGAALVEIYAVP